MRRRVAVLHHETHYHRKTPYLIDFLIDIWRASGIEVIEVFGTSDFIPADVAILHIDVSVVPDMYIHFASQYPVVLNNLVKDICKATISLHLVSVDSPYQGPVIVKSNLNSAGYPERLIEHLESKPSPTLLQRLGRWITPRPTRPPVFQSNQDYQIFDRLSDVPRSFFDNSDVVVEKFFPQMEDGLYCVQNYVVLGKNGYGTFLAGEQPIVNVGTCKRFEINEPASEIIQYCTHHQIEYGKIDYVMSDGKAIVLDVNKTVGAGNFSRPAELFKCYEHLASGIYAYFD